MTAEEKRERDDEDLREVLSTGAGRRLALRLVEEKANLLGLSFSDSDRASCFREGQRSIGLWFLLEARRVAPHSLNRARAEQFAEEEIDLATAGQK